MTTATEAADLATIRAAARELTRHPRMQGRHFGEESAVELLYALGLYLDAQPVVKWPARESESKP